MTMLAFLMQTGSDMIADILLSLALLTFATPAAYRLDLRWERALRLHAFVSLQ
jgi:hypothetical protein